MINTVKAYTYLIKFKITGQVYYGSRSKNIKLGLTPEQDLMVHYFTSCKPLKKLIKQHGVSAFEWQIRRRFDTIEQAVAWEQKVLRRMRVLHDQRWFNQNIAGYIVPTVAGLQKISETHKGVPKNDEHRKRIADALRGHVKTAEHCANMSLAQKGKHMGADASFFGHHHTEENKLAHSKRMKGKTPINKGVAMTQAQKDKISDTKKNNPMLKTEEFKEKMRKAQTLAVESRMRKKLELQNRKPSD